MRNILQISHYNAKFAKGAGSFHMHRKTMKDLWILAVVGVREQPNLAHNLVTHRHCQKLHPKWSQIINL